MKQMIFYPAHNFVQFTRRISEVLMVTSWKVVRTSGETEPWWFFSDWEKDISEVKEYRNENEAFDQFLSLVQELRKKYQHSKQKKNTVAFWNEDEKVFCEDCDDDLQLYHGLLLMEGETPKKLSDEEREKMMAALEMPSSV